MKKIILFLILIFILNSCQTNRKADGLIAKEKEQIGIKKADKKHLDQNGFIKMSEINVKEFLNELIIDETRKNQINLLTTIGQTDKNWLNIKDLEFLVSKVESNEKAKCVNRAISSFLPNPENMTIGNQAISIIESYRQNEPYPNALYICEIYDAEKRNEIRKWWNSKKNGR